MKDLIFEIIDKKGRKIHLSKERYSHIMKHPKMNDSLEILKNTIISPSAVRTNENDEDVLYYYKEFKNNDPEERYLLVSVKYLNGEGFIITSFFTNKITGEKWEVK
jgi:hypothetical protein